MSIPINNFTSTCCKAFNYYDGNEIHCSHCKKVISTIKNDESLTIMAKYNTNPALSAISEDIVLEFNDDAKKYANDKSCEKIDKKCPECNNNTARYLRNPKGEIIYVCTKCRHVFT